MMVVLGGANTINGAGNILCSMMGEYEHFAEVETIIGYSCLVFNVYALSLLSQAS